MPSSLRTLTFAGFSVPQRCAEPKGLVNLPISLRVQKPRSGIRANNRQKQVRGQSWAPKTSQQVLIQTLRLLWRSCFSALEQLSGILLDVNSFCKYGEVLTSDICLRSLREIISNSWWELCAVEDRGQKDAFCNFSRVFWNDPDNVKLRYIGLFPPFLWVRGPLFLFSFYSAVSDRYPYLYASPSKHPQLSLKD